jgi:hypothetical protein
MIARVGIIVFVTFAAWAAAALVAPVLGVGVPAVVSLSAVVLSLVPAIGTLVLSERARQWPPHIQITVLLGCTGIRMMAVVVAAIVLSRTVPVLEAEPRFLGWVILFYLVTLAGEAYVVARLYAKPTAQA